MVHSPREAVACANGTASLYVMARVERERARRSRSVGGRAKRAVSEDKHVPGANNPAFALIRTADAAALVVCLKKDATALSTGAIARRH